jgi:hypothetical protein
MHACVCTIAGVSVQLFGAGTVNANEVLQAWAKAYRNVRDDARYAQHSHLNDVVTR